ncbi:predicted protein [Nematostella vectensis]|uniref:Uncharacterized protein n=1 Tax=Nematostella vectensis TaxID=45351 RepID=A7RSQ9_NEMVE|nr:predicted protein [Nematostella vectensis]|eukprot:XP_001637566.1 predicted protein [Nematostella vectensis]
MEQMVYDFERSTDNSSDTVGDTVGEEEVEEPTKERPLLRRQNAIVKTSSLRESHSVYGETSEENLQKETSQPQTFSKCRQKGGSLPAYHSATIQRGYGLGSILKGLFRWAVPKVSAATKSASLAALKEGVGFAKDALHAYKLPLRKDRLSNTFPVSNLADTGPIQFFSINESGEEVIDVRQAWLYVIVKITKGNGDNLADDDQVGPVNLFLQALFNQVDLTINDKVVSHSTNTNPYRAMFTTLLTYGSDAKSSQLGAEIFYKDTPGKMEATNPLATAVTRNEGLFKRYQLIKNSKLVELMGPLNLDLFHQDRLRFLCPK